SYLLVSPYMPFDRVLPPSHEDAAFRARRSRAARDGRADVASQLVVPERRRPVQPPLEDLLSCVPERRFLRASLEQALHGDLPREGREVCPVGLLPLVGALLDPLDRLDGKHQAAPLVRQDLAM